MKKTVSFTKDLEFPTMIGEITEITLEDNLTFTSSNNIEGSFFIGGKYKMTEASRLEEDFSFNIPTQITLTQNLEKDTCNVSIEDFKYEIVDEEILRCNIDVLVEGREEIELDEDAKKEKEELVIEEEKDTNRECDGDSKENKEIEIPTKDRNEQIDELQEEQIDILQELDLPSNSKESSSLPPMISNEEITTNSLFSNLADEDDSFSTYSIYIMREEDSLEKVMEKYKINKEVLEEYNDISSIGLNSKIIIPNSDEE
jgi:hypothetical protein